ncbi:MAG: peptide chain release factor N(5)-glutamine methyltransferase [Phycisphaerae bacterium]|nr:peptide chain release factor N(5)-glutamine methyltransferase [Phycisphaerae bacterium]
MTKELPKIRCVHRRRRGMSFCMTDPTNEPWTVLRLLDWTKGYFQRAGVESPRLCAEILLAHSLDCGRVDLYARYDHQPDERQLADFRENVKKAAGGQPTAYLVGHKEFYSLSFRVTPAVLIPRPETELLVDQAVAHLRRQDGPTTCWDVCTGSGCVAAAVAKHAPRATLLATDVSPEAVLVAKENVELLGLAERVTCATADLLNVPEAWRGESLFDAITANPPYVADGDELGAGVEYEPASALRAGQDGLAVLRPLIAAVPERLRPGGVFCVEFGRGQADAVRDLIVSTGLEEPTILKDHQSIERAAVTRKK